MNKLKMWIIPKDTKIDINDPIPESAIYCGELDLDNLEENPKKDFIQMPFTVSIKQKKDNNFPELPLKNFGSLDTDKIKFGEKYKLSFNQELFLFENRLTIKLNDFEDQVDIFIEQNRHDQPLIWFEKK